MISYQSLLLSTIVLNDKKVHRIPYLRKEFHRNLIPQKLYTVAPAAGRRAPGL